jgi:dynein heavy chain, axonemal
VVGRLAKEMLDKVPKSYDQFEVMERLRIMGHLNSMNIFLRQEIDRIQKIIKLVRTTLNDLLLAIEGTIIMNEQLRDALDNIYDARVPNIWKRLSWASSTLGFWFTELIERNNQFYSWCFSVRIVWKCGWLGSEINGNLCLGTSKYVLDDGIFQSSRLFDGNATRSG